MLRTQSVIGIAETHWNAATADRWAGLFTLGSVVAAPARPGPAAGRQGGVAAIVPAGSLVVFSSLSLHRSGPNTTNRLRRAYVTQYSPVPIKKPGENEPFHLAVPFLQHGRNVYSQKADV